MTHSNRRPLESETTALPTESQLLPNDWELCCASSFKNRFLWHLVFFHQLSTAPFEKEL